MSKIYRTLSCVLISLTLAGRADALKPVTLAHWGHEKVFIYLPLYVAIDEGFVGGEGLDLKILYSGNDDQVFAAVVSGNAQFGVADPVFAAIARERGGDGKVIATLVGRVSNWGVARNASIPNIDDPRKLDGLRVSSFPAPSTAYSILADLKNTNRLKAMKIIELAPGTEIAAMERGDVDIALTGEPAVSLAESHGYPVVLSLASYYGPFTFSGITTTDQVLANYSNEAQALVTAIQRALTHIRTNPERAVMVASKNFPNLKPDVIRSAIGRMVKDASIPPDARIDLTAWRRMMEMRKTIGDLKNPLSTAAINNSFAQSALGLQAKRSSAAKLGPPAKSEEMEPHAGNRLTVVAWARELLSIIADLAGILTVLALFLLWRHQRIVATFPHDRLVIARLLLSKFNSAKPRPLTAAEIFSVIQEHLGRDAESFYEYFRRNFLRKHPDGGFVLRYHFLSGKHLLEQVVN